MSISRVDKMQYIYRVDYYSAMKKGKTMPFSATWTDLEVITLREVSQKEKDHMILLIHGI